MKVPWMSLPNACWRKSLTKILFRKLQVHILVKSLSSRDQGNTCKEKLQVTSEIERQWKYRLHIFATKADTRFHYKWVSFENLSTAATQTLEIELPSMKIAAFISICLVRKPVLSIIVLRMVIKYHQTLWTSTWLWPCSLNSLGNYLESCG